MKIFYDYLLSFLKPAVIFIGGFHFPYSRKKITGKHYYHWRESIDVGTVILTKTDGELSNFINPTDIKHAGIYVGDILNNGICYVLEAVGKGVVLTDLVTFMTTKDVVVGCKPTFIRNDNEFINVITDSAKKYEGIEYDYLFNKGSEAFYCFELAAKCLKDVYPELQLECKEIIKGKRIYSEETFLDDKFFTIIFDSRINK